MPISVYSIWLSVKSLILHATDSRDKRLVVGFIPLLLFCSILVFLFYQWVLYFSMNPLFPPSGGTLKTFELMYPPPSEGHIPDILLDVKFNVSSHKSIVEGVPLTLTKISAISYRGSYGSWCFSRDIDFVEIGFQHGRPTWNYTILDTNNTTRLLEVRYYEGLSGAQLFNTYHPEYPESAYANLSNSSSKTAISDIRKAYLDFLNQAIPDISEKPIYFENFGVENSPEFNFPVSGDYSPCISIHFRNLTEISYVYNEMKLHVSSESEEEVRLLNRSNFILAFSLFFATLLGAIISIFKWGESAPDKIEGEYGLQWNKR